MQRLWFARIAREFFLFLKNFRFPASHKHKSDNYRQFMKEVRKKMKQKKKKKKKKQETKRKRKKKRTKRKNKSKSKE